MLANFRGSIHWPNISAARPGRHFEGGAAEGIVNVNFTQTKV